MEEIWITLKSMTSYIASAGFIGAIGGMSHYIYQISKGEQFKLHMFVANIFLAGWLCHTISPFVGDEVLGRDGIIGMIGFSVYPILTIIETQIPKIFSKFMKND